MAKQQKTSIFVWEGVNRRGQPAKGELSALNSAYAKAHLRKQGIEPVSYTHLTLPTIYSV